MNIVRRTPQMSRAAFFAWAQAQDARYEFDGVQPVAMTGGTMRHSRIIRSLHAALEARLRGSGCEPAGPDAAVATMGDAVRTPDALVTCGKVADDSLVVPGVVVVFEVLSPSSGRIDRVVKPREYAAVASIRHYIILDHARIALTVFARQTADAAWRMTTLTAGDVLALPDIGIEIPVAAFYANTDLADDGARGGGV